MQPDTVISGENNIILPMIKTDPPSDGHWKTLLPHRTLLIDLQKVVQYTPYIENTEGSRDIGVAACQYNNRLKYKKIKGTYLFCVFDRCTLQKLHSLPFPFELSSDVAIFLDLASL